MWRAPRADTPFLTQGFRSGAAHLPDSLSSPLGLLPSPEPVSGTVPDAIFVGTLPLISQSVRFFFFFLLCTAMDLLAFLAQARHVLYLTPVFALVWKVLLDSPCLPFLQAPSQSMHSFSQ